MSTPIPPANASTDPKCPDANSGAIVPVIDAPAAKDGEAPPSPASLPKNFRTMTDKWHRPWTSKAPSRVGLDKLNASGSAQYSKGQLQAMLSSGHVKLPMIIVDLRQESHGFLQLSAPIYNESTIAVGWFAERDWMSIGKGLVSVEADENSRLASIMPDPKRADPVVNEIKSVNEEGGICKMKPYPVHPVRWATEQQIAKELGCKYIRIPTTDHVRPRDEEVDGFVAVAVIETKRAPNLWWHFHCRGGDGRTTTFLAMHDMIRNAPHVTVEDILLRQYLLGGVPLYGTPPKPTGYEYPFAVEREEFIRRFYDYVCAAKPGGFELSWSKWVATH